MAPKKRSPAIFAQGSAAHPHIDPALEQTSPSTLPPGKKRRQPRDSGPGITSSTQRTVDPSLSSLPIPDSPQHSSEGTVPESTSRRPSTSSTMRTSSIPGIEGPATQTPTGRISKAKKGKRVHACSFEGCGKVSQSAPSRQRDRSCAVHPSPTDVFQDLHQSGASTTT